MPAIFYKVDSDAHWSFERLPASNAILRFAPVRIAAVEPSIPSSCSDAVVLMRVEPQRKWIAFVPADFRLLHNGQPVPAGLRMLAHGDALAVVPGMPAYFSTEEVPCVDTYEENEALSCPRCKLEITRPQTVVRCPACGVIHHELEDRGCWTYAAKCALCPQPTALDAELRWSPELL